MPHSQGGQRQPQAATGGRPGLRVQGSRLLTPRSRRQVTALSRERLPALARPSAPPVLPSACIAPVPDTGPQAPSAPRPHFTHGAHQLGEADADVTERGQRPAGPPSHAEAPPVQTGQEQNCPMRNWNRRSGRGCGLPCRESTGRHRAKGPPGKALEVVTFSQPVTDPSPGARNSSSAPPHHTHCAASARRCLPRSPGQHFRTRPSSAQGGLRGQGWQVPMTGNSDPSPLGSTIHSHRAAASKASRASTARGKRRPRGPVYLHQGQLWRGVPGAPHTSQLQPLSCFLLGVQLLASPQTSVHHTHWARGQTGNKTPTQNRDAHAA